MSKYFETPVFNSFPNRIELLKLLNQYKFLIINIEEGLISQKEVYQLNIELENHAVFYNEPQKKVSFEPSISTHQIKENISEFITAVELFDNLAHKLMYELMEFYSIDTSEIYNFKMNICKNQRGIFNEWEFHFHGGACSFTNINTAQFLDVQMYNYIEFGIIDFYYFLKFIKTTDSLKHLNLLLQDKVGNVFKVCAILKETNILTELPYKFHPRLYLKKH